MLNKDSATTMFGAVGALSMAVNPVLTAVSTQTLHSGDWISLVTAGMFALLGYFTNKK